MNVRIVPLISNYKLQYHVEDESVLCEFKKKQRIFIMVKVIWRNNYAVFSTQIDTEL